MSLSKAPLISKDLVDYLQQIFPNVLPSILIDHAEVALLIGQQKVIAHLLNQYRVQNRPRPIPD